MAFGNVPHPPFQDRPINNPNGSFDAGGPRSIVGTCVHRMDGTLMGTDSFFRNDRPEALTDYGIGGALDGDLDGVIFRWLEPTGRIAPIANGRNNDPEGDGPAFNAAYGPNSINIRLVSIELSGCSGDPEGSTFCRTKPETDVTAAQFESLCQLIAFWHDQIRVPWGSFPVNPASGVNTQMQHFEFSDKACPYPIVRGLTSEYQARVKDIMRAAQGDGDDELEEGVPFEAFPSARMFTVITDGVATARSQPTRAAAPVRDFPSGTIIESDGFFRGESVGTENRWLRTSTEPRLAIHLSGVEEPI